MKLLFAITVIVAFALADEFETNPQSIESDLLASASVESQNSQEFVQPTASRYSYVPPTPAPQKPWVPPNNYNPVNPSTQQNTYYPVQNDPPSANYNYQPENNNPYQTDSTSSWNKPIPNAPSNSWNQNQPQNSWNNQQNTWNNPQNTGNQNTWNKPQNTGNQNSWNKPQNSGSQNTWTNPQNTGTQNSWNKPQNTGNNWNTGNQNNWNNWNQNPTAAPSTTTPISIIKNEQILGDNGSYKYEYEIADGTHVAEEGFVKNPNTEQETIVKKGFYSYTGADGKIYSVTYWADETGFHAVGDHLPKPPPIPPAIQASIDQNAKEEAAKAEAEKNKPQQPQGYPQGQEPPKPIVPLQPVQTPIQTQYPQQIYYPHGQQQQTYYPQQQTYYPSQSYGK
nr:GATA zinc finger domain-containing protein 14-like isoform X2 [Vanessa tameamea]